MMKENAKNVFKYVLAHENENITAQDIADALDLPVKSVNGILTQAGQRHKNADKEPEPLIERVPAVAELPDGTPKPIKLIKMTDAGRAFDYDAAAQPPVADAE